MALGLTRAHSPFIIVSSLRWTVGIRDTDYMTLEILRGFLLRCSTDALVVGGSHSWRIAGNRDFCAPYRFIARGCLSFSKLRASYDTCLSV